jgi:hypothetical protein
MHFDHSGSRGPEQRYRNEKLSDLTSVNRTGEIPVTGWMTDIGVVCRYMRQHDGAAQRAD